MTHEQIAVDIEAMGMLDIKTVTMISMMVRLLLGEIVMRGTSIKTISSDVCKILGSVSIHGRNLQALGDDLFFSHPPPLALACSSNCIFATRILVHVHSLGHTP